MSIDRDDDGGNINSFFIGLIAILVFCFSAYKIIQFFDGSTATKICKTFIPFMEYTNMEINSLRAEMKILYQKLNEYRSESQLHYSEYLHHEHEGGLHLTNKEVNDDFWKIYSGKWVEK